MAAFALSFSFIYYFRPKRDRAPSKNKPPKDVPVFPSNSFPRLRRYEAPKSRAASTPEPMALPRPAQRPQVLPLRQIRGEGGGRPGDNQGLFSGLRAHRPFTSFFR